MFNSSDKELAISSDKELGISAATTELSTTSSTSEHAFSISKSKGGRHYQIHTGGQDGAVAFNALVHNWKKGPSLELRAGSDEKSGVLGVARIDAMGNSTQIGLGDPAQSDLTALDYSGMREKSQFGFKQYDFETDELNAAREQRAYTWIRTSNHPGAFECRDVQSGQVLARYTSRGFWKWTRIGTVTVDLPDPSPRAVHFLLLVFLSWSEMENREAATLAAISH